MSGSTLTAVPSVSRCRLCGCKLAKSVGDDLARGLCIDHKNDARAAQPEPLREAKSAQARPFTPADKALVRSLHGHMPAAQLLEVLNARLLADVGTVHAPYTLEQLHTELQQAIGPGEAQDWAGLRDILARARRCGLLAEVTAHVVDDFAVVFQLSPAQHMRLRDIVRDAQEVP